MPRTMKPSGKLIERNTSFEIYKIEAAKTKQQIFCPVTYMLWVIDRDDYFRFDTLAKAREHGEFIVPKPDPRKTAMPVSGHALNPKGAKGVSWSAPSGGGGSQTKKKKVA